MDKHDLPSNIDRYQIKGLLGEGAMGLILLGYDPKLQREVAIKIVSDAGRAISKAIERFNREARAIAALRHSNIVEIYDYSGPDSQLLYLVMERLDGIDLFDLLDKMGTLPEPVVAGIGKEICSALSAAHQAGVIHRDLKPENVYVERSGRIVLTDFGIAKAFEEDNCIDTDWSSKTEVVGTPGFMAPEQMTGQDLSPQTDLFALGAMLYNVLTRRLPFDGKNPIALYEAIKAQKFKDPRQVQPLISKEMWDILRSCLAVKPKDRPISAEALEQSFAEILNIWGVTDFRSDIRLYLSDPQKYDKFYRQRALDQEFKRLKVALKDHNHDAEAACRIRIELLDPGNREQEQLEESVVFVLDKNGVPHRQGGDKTQEIRRVRQKPRFDWLLWSLVGTFVILLAAVVLLLWPRLFIEEAVIPSPPADIAPAVVVPASAPREDVVPIAPAGSDPLAPEVPAAAANADASTAVEGRANEEREESKQPKHVNLEIQTNRPGQVWLDGKLLGKNVGRKNVRLRAGSKHVIKARSGKSRVITFKFTVPQRDESGALYINFKQGKAKIRWVQNKGQ